MVCAERSDWRKLLICFESMNVIDMYLLEACGYQGRSGGPTRESRSKISIDVESENRERGRKTVQQRGWIDVVMQEGQSR